jgi:putative redox protein
MSEGNGTGSSAGSAGTGAPPAPAAGKPPTRITARWQGEHRFEFGREGGPVTRVDASAKTAPSPVDTLAGALASCTAVDVVDILAKRRTPVASLEVEVVATRANAVPARLTHVLLAYRITGEGIERVHALRAIELAVTKYCSVRDSLDPKLPVEWSLELNGERE